MEHKRVELCWLRPDRQSDLSLPGYETSGSAGMDVEADIESIVLIEPGGIALIPAGFAVSIPDGYELQVRPRSGLAVKSGVTIVNSPGTIDSDYRGEVKIGLINLGDKPYAVHRRDRIAQLVLSPVVRADIRMVKHLDRTDRGAGGFGHTGV
ncbi:MAG: dUTP diphosphatase [Desulforhopalus sp.]